MDFANTNELENWFYPIAINALNYVTAKMLEEIKKDIESKNIGSGGVVYESTGEFKEAWVQEYAKRYGDEGVIADVHYDGSLLSLANDPSEDYPNNFVHGSGYTKRNPYYISDVRNVLPEIIFEGLAGEIFGSGFWTQSRNAWKPFISRTNRSFSKWLREGFKESGLVIKND